MVKFKSGINDNTYIGYNFVHGTCIILHKNIINYIINNFNLYNIIDDVSIAITLKNTKITNLNGQINIYKIFKKIYPYILENELKVVQNLFIDILKKYKKNIYIYRNKYKNRIVDILIMQFITNYLSSKI